MKDQFFTDYLERLEDLQRRLHQAVRDLPAAALDWPPGAEHESNGCPCREDSFTGEVADKLSSR